MAEQIRMRQDILSSAANPSLSANLNFKQLIAKKADENGILFMPIAGKTHDGKQIYQFGPNIKIYMDRSVVFTYHSHNNVWSPVSLQALIDSAHV